MEWNQQSIHELCLALCRPATAYVAAAAPHSTAVVRQRRKKNKDESDAMYQMFLIQQSFRDFQKQCRDLGVYPYLQSAFQQFAEQASDLSRLIQGDLERYKSNTKTIFKTEALQKIRTQILKAAEEKRSTDADL